MTAYTLTVNGVSRPVDGAWLGENLLYVLRERLSLPGAKSGCEQGECGSCSVLTDGDLVCACLVLAASAEGCDIVTIEGIQPDVPGEFTDVQDSFVAEGAVQCGFCTPGLVMAAHQLLASDPRPTPAAVREAMSGNLCRCTGYGRVFAAVEAAMAARSTQ
jgi:carbon-monoxide dehydrogenase small subunit